MFWIRKIIFLCENLSHDDTPWASPLSLPRSGAVEGLERRSRVVPQAPPSKAAFHPGLGQFPVCGVLFAAALIARGAGNHRRAGQGHDERVGGAGPRRRKVAETVEDRLADSYQTKLPSPVCSWPLLTSSQEMSSASNTRAIGPFSVLSSILS